MERDAIIFKASFLQFMVGSIVIRLSLRGQGCCRHSRKSNHIIVCGFGTRHRVWMVRFRILQHFERRWCFVVVASFAGVSISLLYTMTEYTQIYGNIENSV